MAFITVEIFGITHSESYEIEIETEDVDESEIMEAVDSAEDLFLDDYSDKTIKDYKIMGWRYE